MRRIDFTQHPRLLAVILLVTTFAAYQPAWRAGFIWDDDDHLTANPAMSSAHGLRLIWSSLAFSRYYPLTLTTFWVQRRFWGLNPMPYHLVNIALHAINGVLVFMVLRRLRIRAAWLAAMVWVLHPVNVESAAWVTELKNTESGFFFFLAVLCFLRSECGAAAGGGIEPQRHRVHREKPGAGGWGWYALAVVGGGAAMLSKPSTVILPLVLLLCVWWERGGLSRSDRGWWRADLWRIVPFFILALGMSAWTILEQRGHVLRTGTTEWKLSMAERLVIAGKAVWFYAAKLFWPVRLTFVYSRWAMDAEALSSWMPLAGLIVVGSVLWARRRQSWARAGLFGIGFFVAALLPVLGFFDVYYFRYSFVADHFQYLASVGLIAIIAGGGRMVCDRAGRLGRQAGAVAGPVIMLSMAVLTWRQARIYHDAETLWRDTLTKNPQCWMAHTNLGVTLASLHHAREAIEQYKQALRIKPDFATAHNDLGLALTEQGNLPEAIAHYEQAVLIQPGYAEAHSNLGFTLVRLGRVQEAIAHYKRALQIEPEYVQAQYNWGNALLRANKPQEAIEHYEQAVRIDPDLAEAHYNLGLALMGQGELQEAISHYQKALQIKPDYVQAQYNWGNALLRANQPPEAIEHYEQAVRIDPDYVPARNNLAAVLMGQGRLSEAINHLEQVVRLTPEVAMAHYNLGFASEQAGQIQQAIQQYEQALRINPDFVEAQQALARARAAH